MQSTRLYSSHLNSNAKMVEFCGWQMPINYGSQIREHEAVRTDVGMFDVSHMVVTDIRGSDAKSFLRYLISNDVAKLEKHVFGKALYSGMLNENAGIIDDLIVYYTEFGYRLVTNAGTYEKDLAWIKKEAEKFNVTLTERKDLSIVAIQGPNAITKVASIKSHLQEKLTNLKPFTAIEDNGWFYARTGYTGENGLEVIVPNEEVEGFWQDLLNVEVAPCGLAARDTLRLEAGMNLYGHDMDETVNPLECNMDWVVDLNDASRNFIGKEKYLEIKNSNKLIRSQVGLVLEGKGVLREGQKVFIDSKEVGIITSGTFSPSLKMSIAIARVLVNMEDKAFVDIRGNLEPVRIVKLPFVRNGKKVFE